MSALTDLFTSMANKIRSKTGTATTYTPAQMASTGIDDVYAAGAASVPTPTSITPSNSSPVALTANSAVNPTSNGYAIYSYNSITPSAPNPPSLETGKLYKVTTSGYAIKAYYARTPSDSNPTVLESGKFYIIQNNNGYAVESLPINIYNPNIIWTGNIAANSTQAITVTQTPRLVIHTFARYGGSNTDGWHVTRINDIANNKHASAYYLSGGYSNEKDVSGLSGLTVTSSSVTVDPGRSYTTRNEVFIYY